MNLRWRLTLLYLGASTLVLSLALFSLNHVYQSGVVSVVDRTLESALDQASPSNLQQLSDLHDSLFIQSSGKDGSIQFQSDPDMPHVLAGIPCPSSLKTKNNLRVLSLISDSGCVVVGQILPSQSLFSRRDSWRLVLIGFVTIGLLGIVGWLLAGRALQRLQQASQKLHHFTSNVSHQLRTPLTILRGEIEVALNGNLNDAQYKELLKSNLSELETLSGVVSDLLVYARNEQEALVKPGLYPLKPFLEQVAHKAKVLCQAKHIAFSSDLQPVQAVFHRGRFEQALLNALDNAVKYSPEGSTVSLSNEIAKNEVVVVIQDNGPGMAARDIHDSFERSGSGIGLGLAKALVESFSGHFHVKLPEEGGLRVVIRLARKLA